MRISSLKYFFEVANLKSISKVSNDLHISQPALSHQLSKLEKDLGVKLFERSNRGVELTEKGKILYNYAKDILSLHSNLINEIEENESSTKEITISFLSSYSAILIEDIAKNLSTIFDDVKVNINISQNQDNNDKASLLHNKTDVIIGCKKIEDADLVSKYIGSDKLILVSEKHVSCKVVEDISFALLDNGLELSKKGCISMNNMKIALKTDSIDVIKSYLKGENVAAIVPNSTVKKELESGDLTRICACDSEIEYDIFMTHRKDLDSKLKRQLNEFKKALEYILIKDQFKK